MFFYSVCLRNRKYDASRVSIGENPPKMWWFGQKNHTVRKFLYACSIESRKSNKIPIQIETR